MFKKVLGAALVASALFSASASAEIYNYGAHDADETGIFNVYAPGAFTDTHFFTMPSPYSGTESIFVSLNWTGATITNSSVGLYSGFGLAKVEHAWTTFDGSFSGFDDVLLANNLIPGGEYYFEVNGIALGNNGATPTNPSTPQIYGVYAMSSTLSLSEVIPVPEADTYAMMLAGFTALGFMARRRRNLM